MPSQIHRTPSIEHRLRHPNSPLIVHAQEFHIEGQDSDGGSSFHTVSVSDESTTPSEELATMLDREHRVNRIQAEDLARLRTEIRRLRTAAERMPPTDPKVTTPRSDRIQNAIRENMELHEENTKLHSRIEVLLGEISLKDRQIAELEKQLHDISTRLNDALRTIDAKNKELDTYILPSSAYDPVKTVTQTFSHMTVGELNQASLALGSTMSEARAKATMSTSTLENFYSASRRPITALYDSRPQSALNMHTSTKESQAKTGAALLSPLGSTSEDYASSDSVAYPEGKKSVKFADEETGTKKRKGKFNVSASRFWMKK
ncbi:hypothetical protein C1H76_0385 [Elsinoe australis]|uniref:Uncharacterized protein n=1 Tax=Elsinoe australis TaxID=40998 RepID=A0A4U7BH09_9PEZI|nr:hypothetical protein C1H76_0385 [Elsinoe australis]